MTITARYPGRCAKCGAKIRAGDQIGWSRGKATCLDCAPAPKAAPAPKPAIRVEVLEDFRLEPSVASSTLRFAYRPEAGGDIQWGQDVGERGFCFRGPDTYEALNAEAVLPLALAAKARLISERNTMLASLKADIVEGRRPIQIAYREGEYLSGHTVSMDDYDATVIAAKLMVEAGAAQYVNGWGEHVNSAIVDALGTEFTYPQLTEFLRPAREAAETKQQAAATARKAKFATAQASGKPVLLRSWSEPCNDPDESCDIDNLTEWALPNGQTRIKRAHTW